jgi:hypothetical protein
VDFFLRFLHLSIIFISFTPSPQSSPQGRGGFEN